MLLLIREKRVFYDRIYLFLLKIWRRYCEAGHYRQCRKFLKCSGLKRRKLNKSQKNEVTALWGRVNFHTHELVYSVTGNFNPKIVPEIFIRLKMEILLNNQMEKNTLSDKNLFERIIGRDHMPVTLIRNIDGELYDSDYEYITADQAIEIAAREGEIFCKPAIDNGSGKGVSVISSLDLNTIRSLGANWIAQRIIKPCPAFRRLNSTAVSIMRMITFYIEGEVYLTSVSMRIGIEGAIKDYTESDTGDGSIIIGVDKSGSLKEHGIYPNGKKVSELENGFKFGGMKIPGFNKAADIVKDKAKKLPQARFINWDITIDEDEEPVIVEYNIKGSGVLYYQYTNGSLFGEYFDLIHGKIMKSLQKGGNK